MRNMAFYSSKGLVSNERPVDVSFYIQENLDIDFYPSRYVYHGDELLYRLENRCVELYDLFRDKIFTNRADYDFLSLIMPIGLVEGGLASDCAISKMFFKRFFEEDYSEKGLPSTFSTPQIEQFKFHYAYMVDCQSLIATLQELILAANDSFIGFYKLLSTVPETKGFDTTYFAINSEGRLAFNMLHSLIIQLYSIFDITTKIAYELENIKPCAGAYVRMASKGILYGDRKKLTMDKSGTIYESDRQLSIVENLRNELVHNATWEMHPKVFFIKEKGVLLERRIHLPDLTEEGNLVTYKNRKRFFSDGKTVNEELPTLYLGVMNRLYKTLMKLT